LGTLRRSLALTGPLVAVATVAITAATWHATSRDGFTGAADVDRILGTESEPADIQLHSGASPFFTTTGALATVETGWHGEAAMPVATMAGGEAGLTHRAWTGFTTSGAPSFHSGPGASRPRNGASGGRSSFGHAISGMSMSGGWGGVSGSAGKGGATTASKASPTSSIAQRAIGGAPSAQGAASPARHVPATEAASHEVAEVVPATPDAAHAIAPAVGPAAGIVFHDAAGPAAPVAGGAVHQQAEPHPSPAATPEPVTMVLVGIGAAALYRLRRYLV
jgi:hypothetical protein